MNLSDKELRKLLNAAWGEGRNYAYGPHEWRYLTCPGRGRRYRGVSKIIEGARQNQKPHRITRECYAN